MGTFQYHEQIPANARIVVDYTKAPKDRVAFSYPRHYTLQHAITKAGIATIIMVYIIVLLYVALPAFLLFNLGNIAYALLVNPQDLHILTQQLAVHSASSFYFNPWSLFVGTTTITPTIVTYTYNSPISNLLPLIALLIGGIVMLLYMKKNPKFAQDYIPKANYMSVKLLGAIHKIKVYPDDIDIKDKVFVLPSFSNVYLDYDATGEFSSKLEKVEVLEYPRNWARVFSNGKEKRPKPNEYDWRCVFFFTSKPKNGELLIKYH